MQQTDHGLVVRPGWFDQRSTEGQRGREQGQHPQLVTLMRTRLPFAPSAGTATRWGARPGKGSNDGRQRQACGGRKVLMRSATCADRGSLRPAVAAKWSSIAQNLDMLTADN